jgi:FRG domain
MSCYPSNDYFQHCGVQFCDQRIDGEEWDWDWYFLMQHHSAPTRLLDWSNGALIALHFAVQSKRFGDTEDAFVYVVEPDRLKQSVLRSSSCE